MPTPQVIYQRDQVALGVLLAAYNFGVQMRVRDSVSDPYPRTIWAMCPCGETGITTLRDGKYTGQHQLTVMVPRQLGFSFDSPMQPGPILETVLGSNRWYEISEIGYCSGNPGDSSVYSLTCTSTDDDPQPTT